MRYLLISPKGEVIDFKRYSDLVSYAEQKEINLMEYDMEQVFVCRMCRMWYPVYHKNKKSAICIHCQEKVEEN